MQILKRIAENAVPSVDTDSCGGCIPCSARRACASGAIVVVDRGEPPWVDASRCHGCRACILACPFSAVLLPNGELSLAPIDHTL